MWKITSSGAFWIVAKQDSAWVPWDPNGVSKSPQMPKCPKAWMLLCLHSVLVLLPKLHTCLFFCGGILNASKEDICISRSYCFVSVTKTQKVWSTAKVGRIVMWGLTHLVAVLSKTFFIRGQNTVLIPLRILFLKITETIISAIF